MQPPPPEDFWTRPLKEAFELHPGDEIGNFVIDGEPREGGWGFLYPAHERDASAARAVVKTIKPENATRRSWRHRFEMEQEALEEIPRHANLSPPLETGRSDAGLLWFAMRWIEGEDLYEVVGGRPLDPVRAARLVAQAAEGLDEVHRTKKIVHRDIHPGNLMVEHNDHLLVIDFGLAKRFDHLGGSPPEPLESEWAAPEGRRGEKMTPQSDVYSLGLVLAFLLTADPPSFEGPRFRPDLEVDPDLRRIIEEATRPDRSGIAERPSRTKTAGRLAQQLRAYERPDPLTPSAATGADTASRSSPSRGVAAPLVAAMALLLAVAAFVATNGIGSTRSGSDQRPTIEADGLAFALPDGWRPTPVSVSDRRLGLREAAVGPDTLTLIGSIRRSHVPGYAPSHDAVEVELPAGTALRAENDRQLDARMLYVFDSGGTYSALLCRGMYGASTTAVATDCESVARRLTVSPPPSAPAYPSERVQLQANDAFSNYAEARKRVTEQMRSARTHGQVAAAASRMAKESARIASALNASSMSSLKDSFVRVREAWSSAAQAARRQNGFQGAGRRVGAAESSIRKARTRLVNLGYQADGTRR